MKKIVIIGANSFQNPLILKAKELGYETHVFAWQDGSVGERTADYFYPISIIEKDRILEECRKIKPCAVTTIASDLAMITAQYIAEHLGLVCNSAHSMFVSSNKYAMRKQLYDSGLPTPRFAFVANGKEEHVVKDFSFPIIVKPTDRSGSRAITKLYDLNGFEEAVTCAIENSFEKKAIVEEYIEGEEYSFEAISYQGQHYNLAITKKYTTGEPHYIETGHLQPCGLSGELCEKVKEQIYSALDALEIRYGASHAEFKVDKNDNIRIIEIGARMGGDCIGSDLVKISTGYDFLKMVIDIAVGGKPDFVRICEPKTAVIKFIFSQEDLEQLAWIKENEADKIYFISDINIGNQSDIVDSSTRYGYYILACNSTEDAKRLTLL